MLKVEHFLYMLYRSKFPRTSQKGLGRDDLRFARIILDNQLSAILEKSSFDATDGDHKWANYRLAKSNSVSW